jgi:ligand-binding sensor domain-containing protein
VNADQVKALVANNVRLNADGEVEVVDQKGAVRYNDRGESLGVEDLVREFLDSNPHFVSSTPATTHTRSNVTNNSVGDIDISKLDMRLVEHRKIYANLKSQKKI